MSRVSRLVPLLGVLALCVPALWPLWSVTFWTSHDGLHHIFRILDFDAAVRSGTLYPRWAAGLGFGYGFPVTHYYAPLAYFAAETFHLLGSGILDSIKLVYALGIFGSALGMVMLARLYVSRWGSLIAAAAYVYYPYHIADIYMRGTLTEFAALALLPWIVWAMIVEVLNAPVIENASSPPRWFSVLRRLPIPIRFSLLLAALILTHNLSAFLFLPVLGAYLGIVTVAMRRERPLLLKQVYVRFAAGILLAFALTAYYWLPALGEVAWIRAGQVSSGVDDISSLLTPLPQFVSLYALQPYVPDAPAGLQHPLGLLVAVFSLLFSVVIVIRRRSLLPEARAAWLAWLLIALAAVFAMLDLSAPLWNAIRPLAFVQYPYRLHAILSLALAMLIGLGWHAAMDGFVPRHAPLASRHSAIALVVGGAFMAALMVASLGELSLVPQVLPGHKEAIDESQVNLSGMSEYDYQTALWARLYGGPWLLEYLPAWVTEAREEFFLPSQRPPSDVSVPVPARVTMIAAEPERQALQTESDSPFLLTFHTFYFPAWQVRIDGAAIRTYPVGSLALVGADVPAGSHHVTLEFEGTAWQQLGETIGLMAVLALAAWIVFRSSHRVVWLSGALLLAVGALGWQSVELHAESVPQPVIATLDNRIDLIAYAVPQHSIAPGDIIEVTLYWLARKATAENLKVFVHLDDEKGRAGQADAQPGFNFSPTSRWLPGEVVADHYRLKTSANSAPGVYTLYAGMYRTQPVQNLQVVSPNATPDNRIRLGELSIVGPK